MPKQMIQKMKLKNLQKNEENEETKEYGSSIASSSPLNQKADVSENEDDQKTLILQHLRKERTITKARNRI